MLIGAATAYDDECIVPVLEFRAPVFWSGIGQLFRATAALCAAGELRANQCPEWREFYQSEGLFFGRERESSESS